jgi:hypothetical protein
MVRRVLLIATAGLLAASCGDDGTDFLGVEPQVHNVVDVFEFQINELQAETHTLTYSWLNTGTTATVHQEGSVFGGDVRLEILDGGGRRVYFRDLSATGTFTTEAGQTGGWTIRVVLSQAGGSFNFRVAKKT